MNWYPRYYGDYMRDTGHLSLAEDGAYGRLLDHYYATGKPLPANAEQVHRICRAVAPAEQDAVKVVLAGFFTLESDGYHNHRADREISKLHTISDLRRDAAHKMHAKHTGKKDAQADANAGASAATSTSTSTVLQPPPPSHPPESPKEREFDLFWKEYPRKTGKKAAKRAWLAAKDKPSLDKIISAVQKQRTWQDWIKDGGQYIPHPATWLNQGRWDDERTAIRVQGNQI